MVGLLGCVVQAPSRCGSDPVQFCLSTSRSASPWLLISFDSVVDDSLGCTVVCLDWCSGLRVTKLLEALSHGEDLLRIGV